MYVYDISNELNVTLESYFHNDKPGALFSGAKWVSNNDGLEENLLIPYKAFRRLKLTT